MNNYKIQDGCHNCKHRISSILQEDMPDYYCNYKKDIPKYNHIHNNVWDDGENPSGLAYVDDLNEVAINTIQDRMDHANEWETTCRVVAHGVCALFNKE